MKTLRFSDLFGIMILVYPPLISVALAISGVKVPSTLIVYLITVPLFFAAFRVHSNARLPVNHFRLPFGIYYLLLVCSLTYSPASISSISKIYNVTYMIFTPIIILLLAEVILAKNEGPVDNKRILYHVTIGLMILSLLFFGFSFEETPGRYILPGLDNPIWLSRYFGLCFISIYIALKIKIIKMTGFWGAALTLSLVLTVFSGARAPLIAIAAIALIDSYIISKKHFAYTSLIVFTAASIGFTYLGGLYIFETDLYSLYHRYDSIEAAFSHNNYLFGNGVSSFGLLYYEDDVDMYPHNIFAESFFELGLLGLVLVIYVCYKFLKNFRRNIINYIALYCLVNSLSSGDIASNASFFVAVYMAGRKSKVVAESKISTSNSRRYIQTYSVFNQE